MNYSHPPPGSTSPLVPPRLSLPPLCCSRVTYFLPSLTALAPRFFDRFSREPQHLAMRPNYSIPPLVFLLSGCELCLFWLSIILAFSRVKKFMTSLSPFFVYFLPSLSVPPAVHRPYLAFFSFIFHSCHIFEPLSPRVLLSILYPPPAH